MAKSKRKGLFSRVRSMMDNVMGYKDWEGMVKSSGPLSPADMRKNPKKYKDKLKEEKRKRIKKATRYGGGRGKSW